MLVKIGTLTNPDIEDKIEEIDAARSSKPIEEEVEYIYNSTQTLYYNSDTKEFFRGYNNSRTFHHEGIKEYTKKINLRKSHIISKSYEGFTIEIISDLYNIYRCNNALLE
jgi:hypothetical protein